MTRWFSALTGADVLSKEAMLLFVHRMLLRVGIVGLSAFVVVRLYEHFGGSLAHVALVYAAVYFLTFTLTPVAARLIRHWGIQRMLILAAPLSGVSIIVLTLLDTQPLFAVAAYIGTFSLYKILYWVPYQVDLAASLDINTRGRQLALFSNISDVFIAAMPLLGGILIAQAGFTFSFVLGGMLIFAGVIPIFFMTTVYESYSWGYRETIRQFFHTRNRALILAYFGDGMQLATLSIVWTIFVFTLLSGEYAALGLVTALTLLALMALRTITGGLFDMGNKNRVLLIGAVLASTGWIVKLLVATPIQVVLSDTYHGMGRATRRTSIDAISYEQAADNGRYVDEFTVLKEMALAAGRLTLLVAVGAVAWFITFDVAVFLAIVISAFSTLGSIYLGRRVHLTQV